MVDRPNRKISILNTRLSPGTKRLILKNGVLAYNCGESKHQGEKHVCSERDNPETYLQDFFSKSIFQGL